MNIKFDTRYKFTAKELDNETSYTYFGARYYDSDLSIWLSVDPMSDERRWVSPYAYCQWNPLILVDPSGMLDDNYTVDEQGYIKLEEKTDDDFDMLYTKESWDNGTKDKSIKVDKGVLNSKKTFSITDKKTEEKFSLDMYQVKGDDKARSLFNFG
ncbi:MAG: RHS repeat-associated core domain-containing protein [Bacteroidales bacterium]|nr:RHS repeat-associated core domain-containing protein [Bacteroidales bacterium]